MFFDDEKLELKKRATLRAPPQIPDTKWQPPQYYPDLSDASVIAFDVETKELDWPNGPGWSRGPAGHIVGFSIAARKRQSGECGKWYFPVRHEVEAEFNLDANKSFNWLRSVLETPSIPKVGASLLYDVGWLTEENIFVEGDLYDCQYAESLLDEDALVALDNLGHKYCGEGKESSLLYDWIRQAYHPKERELRGEIWRSPPRLVGPYGEQDADLPIRVLERQWPLLARQNLIPLFQMECSLIRLLVRMRMTGVRVDLDYAAQLYTKFDKELQRLNEKIYQDTGFRVNVNSAEELGPLFDSLNIKYPLTPGGKPSLQKEFMENLHHPVTDTINMARRLGKLNSTFIKGALLEGSHKGRIHTQFHPLRSDKGEGQEGARTGRFSSSDPNLQNIPVRSDEGKQIRYAFIPDEGHCAWEKDDMSQQEYRYLAHYAVDNGDGSADRLRAEYNTNPKTDYHQNVYIAACPFLGWNPNESKELQAKHRRPIKNTNFGLIYGQGQILLAIKLGLTRKESAKFFEGYHKAAPWVKPTMAAIAAEVQEFGYVTTILGRRCRFNLWEPIIQPRGTDRRFALPYDAAIREYGHAIKRAYDYRGVNYKFQGSNADHMKKWMQMAYQAGVFDVIGIPKITVHDELGFSVIDDSRQQDEAYAELRHIFEKSIPLRVPVRADSKRGLTWGNAD